MNNENTPAFPIPDAYNGLTKREYFAAKAPEIPDWFEHEKAEYPKEPKSWINMSNDDPFKEEAKNWFHDPCYDIRSEELKWFQEAWEKFWKERDVWNKQDKASRYFQWRCYYADQLLAQLDSKSTN